MASLSLRHVEKRYPNGFVAVKDFNLEIADKEFIIFVGPSGCGKSTTLRMIAGLEDIRIAAFPQTQVLQIAGCSDENIFNLHNRKKGETFLVFRLGNQSDINALLFQHGEGVRSGLVFNGNLNMRIFLNKSLQIRKHDKTAQGIADADTDMS